MAEKWERVKVLNCPDLEGEYRVRAEDSDSCHRSILVVEKKVEAWKDVTRACRLEFRDSRHCDGRYIAVIHCGDQAAIIGIQGIVAQKGFKVEKAPMAYTSFKVFKKG